MKPLFYLVLCCLLFTACKDSSENESTHATTKNTPATLFEKQPADKTNIDFTNKLILTPELDVFHFRNYYNGGGVAIGDINNDGLADIYLTANMQANKLFLNKGNLEFEDITAKAKVGGTRAWSTGVSMADVNGDGLLDIYVCNSGNIKDDDKENELFINNGDLTFTERAAEFKLDDQGYSTHAAFLDFDKDGDLDCYLLNNSFRSVNSFPLKNDRTIRDEKGGDKLLRNENGQGFTDISNEAGILGSEIAFGLGIAIGDINNDQWPDIYISNDFFERDYLYINNQNGSFTESLTDYLRHSSEFSMGSDIADINNDGHPEIFVTDMLPHSDYRLKTTTSFSSYDLQERRLQFDYYHQTMHNTMQLNNGNGTFSEIGLYSGTAATDWSWGALIADFDNSGEKEIFVTNGVYKDVTDQDFIAYYNDPERVRKIQESLANSKEKNKIDFTKMVNDMPSTKLPNYLFKRAAPSMKFTNEAAAFGLGDSSFSNGSAYGDLDNDGDLDLVVNNVNMPVFVYENKTNELLKHNFIQLNLIGEGLNKFGIGTKIKVCAQNNTTYYEHFPTKGFQSSMDYKITLGVGQASKIDSVVITWPDDRRTMISDVEVNRLLKPEQKNALKKEAKKAQTPAVFTKVSPKLSPAFVHTENRYIDFDHERLTMHMLSREGPALAVADLNNDGLDDFFIGNAINQEGEIYLQHANGFSALPDSKFKDQANHEEVDAVFLDIDNDKDLDLYIVSGGNELGRNNLHFRDQLFENTGTVNAPQFKLRTDLIPSMEFSGSCVRPCDFDDDGDIDLFVGSRVYPGQYGVRTSSFLLENDGSGKFTNVTSERIPQLRDIGMVTDAVWSDFDNNGSHDLIVVGEWMPVSIFKNKGVGFQKLSEPKGLENTYGLWNTIAVKDLNGDGMDDYILGNLGLNSRFKATPEKPLSLIINDFDKNGSIDHIYAHDVDGKLKPFSTKKDMDMQLNYLKNENLYFKDYAKKDVYELFGKKNIDRSSILKVNNLASVVISGNGDGTFDVSPLPEALQFSSVQTFGLLNDTQKTSIIAAGNFSATKPELGNYDACYGRFMEVNEKGHLENIPSKITGLKITGDVRNCAFLRSTNNSKLLIFAKNNDKPSFYRLDK